MAAMKQNTLGPWVPCSIEGCNDRVCAKGYCNKHYAKLKRHGLLTHQDRGSGAPSPGPEPILFPRIPYAVCASEDPSLWDDRVEGESNEDRDLRVDLAQRMCRKCPSQIQCRTYQLEMRDKQPVYGVWGGVLVEAPSLKARRRKAS